MNRIYFALLMIIILLSTLTNLSLGQNNKPQKSQNKSTTKGLSKAEDSILTIRAVEKLKDLERQLARIADKTIPSNTRQGLITQGKKLFISKGEKTTVEISSLNNKVPRREKLDTYLNDLFFIKYTHTEIKFASIQYVSNLKRQPDGTWVGTISFEQEFTGSFKNNEFKPYHDKTKKDIQVIVELIAQSHGNKTTYEWEPFLGDMKVTATK